MVVVLPVQVRILCRLTSRYRPMRRSAGATGLVAVRMSDCGWLTYRAASASGYRTAHCCRPAQLPGLGRALLRGGGVVQL